MFIPKPGKQSYLEAKSYRPITLTSFLLKGLECLIDLHIRETCLQKKPLSKFQHAYLPGKSVDSALHNLIQRIEKARSRNNDVLVAFLDIQGAFDNTCPTIIVPALQRNNVDMFIKKTN